MSPGLTPPSPAQRRQPARAGSRPHESIVTLALDLLSDRRDTVALLLKVINVVEQIISLRHTTILRVAQRWLLLAVRSPLLAHDVLESGFALITLQFQVVDQPAYLRAWFFDPARCAPGTHKHETGNQHSSNHSLNHVFQRTSRNEAFNISRRPQRFHRIGRSKRTSAFLHPDSVGSGVSVVMLNRLFEGGAVCARA